MNFWKWELIRNLKCSGGGGGSGGGWGSGGGGGGGSWMPGDGGYGKLKNAIV